MKTKVSILAAVLALAGLTVTSRAGDSWDVSVRFSNGRVSTEYYASRPRLVDWHWHTVRGCYVACYSPCCCQPRVQYCGPCRPSQYRPEPQWNHHGKNHGSHGQHPQISHGGNAGHGSYGTQSSPHKGHEGGNYSQPAKGKLPGGPANRRH